MGKASYSKDSSFYRVKKTLDKLLPLMLLIVVFYLYLDLLASTQNILYGYKIHLQYIILAYFVADLSVLFSMYEENRRFFKNHWFDILLTILFLTAFKGLKGLKIIKMTKGTKVLKGVKIGQKTGKVVKKTKKLIDKKKSPELSI